MSAEKGFCLPESGIVSAGMARRPVVPDAPRDERVTLRLTAGEVALLDELRGAATRAEFLRRPLTATPEAFAPKVTPRPDPSWPAPAPPLAGHRHRPEAIAGRRWLAGREHGSPVCSCGTVLSERALSTNDAALPDT